MATHTLATSGNLTAVTYLPGYGSGLLAADIAAIANGIKNDLSNSLPIVPGSFSSAGQLFVPNRGVLQVLPGDVVAIDGHGGVILVTKYGIANGPWTYT